MILKEFYVIVNKNGEFFHIDKHSGGYPCFMDTYTIAEKYNTKEDVDEFLNSNYHKLFEKEFRDICIKKITVIMEDI